MNNLTLGITSGEKSPSMSATAIMYIILGVYIVLSNALVLLVCIVERRGLLKESRFVFLGCVAAADACLGVICAVRGVVPVTGVSLFWCLTIYGVGGANLVASPLFLMAATLNQYMAISRPLHYLQVVTRGRVLTVVLAVWSLSLAMLLWVVFGHTEDTICHSIAVYSTPQKFVLCLIMVFHILVSLVVYIKIFAIIKSHSRVMDAQVHGQGTTEAESLGQDEAANESMKREVKTVVNMFIVIASFIIMVSPWCFVVFASVFDESYAKNYNLLIGLLVMCNSGVNPIVYTFRFQQFRDAFRKLLPY